MTGTNLAIGELASAQVPLSASEYCADVDMLFGRDPSLRSLLVDHEGVIRILDRDEFYEFLTGRLGYGWALHVRKPLSSLLGSLRPATAFWADTPSAEVALALIAAGTGGTGDLLVCWPDGTHGTVAASVVLTELSEDYRAQFKAAGASERRFRALVQSSSDVVMLVDACGTVLYVSESSMGVVGRNPEDRLGKNAFDIVHSDDVEHLDLLLQRSLDCPGVDLTAEFRMQVQSGEWRRFELTGRNMLNDPDVNAIVVNYRDVTDRRLLEAQLWHQAFHDGLTSLANRQAFAEHGRRALQHVGRTGALVGVLLLDLDSFKSVNDTLGHHVGDEVLIAASDRIRSVLRDGDLLARLGGDEFAILIETSAQSAIWHLAQRVLSALSAPVDTSTGPVLAHGSLGIAVAEDSAIDIDELLRRADLAMYASKANGRNRWTAWSIGLQHDATGLHTTAADLHRALATDELVLHYQPIVDVPTQAVVGLEALVRWQHPVGGLLPPSAFIGVAEQSGLIIELGQWVLRCACRQAMVWRNQFPHTAHMHMAVNVSPLQLLQPGFTTCLDEILRQTGVDPFTLELEITEEAVVRDPQTTIRTLLNLKSLGVRLAVDDFGTGYSSHSHLRRFPVDILKIDRSFIERIDEHPADRAIVENMISLGHALDLDVVAEGVEHDSQADHLQSLRCDRAQGYHFGRPAAPETLEHMLASSPGRPEHPPVGGTRMAGSPYPTRIDHRAPG